MHCCMVDTGISQIDFTIRVKFDSEIFYLIKAFSPQHPLEWISYLRRGLCHHGESYVCQVYLESPKSGFLKESS